MRQAAVLLSMVLFTSHAYALGIADLSNTEASGGLKEALIQGRARRLANWAQRMEFFGNPEVRFRYPGI